jgi:hypothetical protein
MPTEQKQELKTARDRISEAGKKDSSVYTGGGPSGGFKQGGLMKKRKKK